MATILPEPTLLPNLPPATYDDAEFGAYSEAVQKNILVADKIIAYVKRAIPNSISFMSRNPDLDDIPENSHLFDKIREESGQLNSRFYETNLKDPKCFSDLNVMVVQKGCGNCRLMSHVGFEYGKKDLAYSGVELAKIENGDHYFLVLGRDPKSDKRDYQTWGDSSVIADPWTGNCYPVSDIKTKLHDYLTVATSKYGMNYPVVKRFDPSSQRLYVKTKYNILYQK